jgi:hypothetical protein
MVLIKNACAAFIVVFITASCATRGSVGVRTYEQEIQTVSVSAFTCNNPEIAYIVQAKIIEQLLNNYTVVIGDKSDVEVKGSIELSGDNISAINTQIIKDGKTLLFDTMSPATAESPELTGRKVGARILGFLQRHSM